MRSAFHCFLVWCPISKAWDGKWVIPRPSVISTEPERIEDSVQNRSRVFFLVFFFKRFAAQVQPSRPVPRELEKSCFFLRSKLQTEEEGGGGVGVNSPRESGCLLAHPPRFRTCSLADSARARNPLEAWRPAAGPAACHSATSQPIRTREPNMRHDLLWTGRAGFYVAPIGWRES